MLSGVQGHTEGTYEDSVRHPHDEVRRKGLRGQLPDGRDRADERVLVPRQVRRLAEAEGGAVAQHRLVQDLEEVDPDEDRQDDLVRLPPDAPILCMLVGVLRLGPGSLPARASIVPTPRAFINVHLPQSRRLAGRR